MLIRQACGVKTTHPFDDFPEHKRKRTLAIPLASEVRANLRAYMEAMKNHGETQKGS